MDNNYRGQVAVEFIDTEAKIREIEKKLLEYANVHGEFRDKLKYSPEKLWKPGQPDRAISVEQYEVKKLPILADWQTPFDLADELRVAKARLRELEYEKAHLNLY